MPPDLTDKQFDLLVFTAPNLPDVMLAVTLIEVLECTDLAVPTPIPFTPPTILGLGKWRNSVVTVFDMGCLLGGQSSVSSSAYWQYLVARVVVHQQLDVVAWPILPGARIVRFPSLATQAELPSYFNPALVRASISLDSHFVILLNLDRLERVINFNLDFSENKH